MDEKIYKKVTITIELDQLEPEKMYVNIITGTVNTGADWMEMFVNFLQHRNRWDDFTNRSLFEAKEIDKFFIHENKCYEAKKR